MANTPTYNKTINKPAIGDTGWGTTLNVDFDGIDAAFGNSVTLTNTASFSLTPAQCQNMCLTFTGSTTGDITATIPASQSGAPNYIAGQWVVRNLTPHSVIVASAAGTPSVTIPSGSIRSIYCDGTSAGVIFADGQSAGSNNQVIFNTAGSLSGSSDLTFDGINLSVGASIALTGASTAGSGPYTATVTFSGSKVIAVGSSVIVSGVTPAGYNGTWTVTASSAGSVSYTVSSALTSGSGGNIIYGAVQAGGSTVSVPSVNENRTAGVTTTAAADAFASSAYTPSPVGGNIKTITSSATPTSCTGSWTSGVATLTGTGGFTHPVGSTIIVSGMSVAGYNGTFVVTASTSNTVSYAVAATLAAGTGGSVSGGLTINAPTASGSYTLVVKITNASSNAGNIALSGFTAKTGSSFTAVANSIFMLYITKVDSTTVANVLALQ